MAGISKRFGVAAKIQSAIETFHIKKITKRAYERVNYLCTANDEECSEFWNGVIE